MPLITAPLGSRKAGSLLQRRYLPQTIPSPVPLRHSERSEDGFSPQVYPGGCLPRRSAAKSGLAVAVAATTSSIRHPLYATRYTLSFTLPALRLVHRSFSEDGSFSGEGLAKAEAKNLSPVRYPLYAIRYLLPCLPCEAPPFRAKKGAKSRNLLKQKPASSCSTVTCSTTLFTARELGLKQ